MPELSTPKTITKAAFAARHGVTTSRVTELLAEGLPVTRNGRIDVAAGDAWIGTHLDPVRRAAAKRKGAASSQAKTVAASRAKKLDRENAILDLELAKRRGEVIDRAETLRALADFATLHRDAWLGWIARAAPEIAAAVGTEPGPLVAALDRTVRRHLADLARMPLPEFARDAG